MRATWRRGLLPACLLTACAFWSCKSSETPVGKPPPTPPPKNHLLIKLINAEGQPGLKRFNKSAQLYSYSTDQAWIQFSFKERPFEAPNVIAAIKKQFKYCSLELRFPEKYTPKIRAYSQLQGPLWALDELKDFPNYKQLKLTFTKYDNGRLTGEITGVIMQITKKIADPKAVSGDIAGHRYESEKCDIPFTIEFSLTVSPDDQFDK